MPGQRGAGRHSRPVLGVLHVAGVGGGSGVLRVPRASGRESETARRRRQRAVVGDPLAQLRGRAASLPRGQGRFHSRQRRCVARRRTEHILERRRTQSECRAHRVPPLRQRHRRAGAGRHSAANRMADRLPHPGTHPLPAGRGLRCVRHSFAPGDDAHVHGLPAHGVGDELRRLPAAGDVARPRSISGTAAPRRTCATI